MIDDFIKMQSELPKLQKTEENPFFKSAYVPLDQVLDKVLPVLHKNNFAVIQAVTHTEDNQPELTTKLIHSSGTEIASEMLLMSKSADPQGQGSAITYARRYALVSMLGLTVGEDDDGNAATTAEAKAEEEARMATPPGTVANFLRILKEKGVDNKEDAVKVLDSIEPSWKKLNTSGVTRTTKVLENVMPDTIDLIKSGETL